MKRALQDLSQHTVDTLISDEPPNNPPYWSHPIYLEEQNSFRFLQWEEKVSGGC